MAATVLLRLAGLTGDGRYVSAAERTVAPLLPLAARHPTAFAQWLLAASLAHSRVDEVAIVGDPTDAGTPALLGEVRRGYRPWQVVALRDDPDASGRAAAPRAQPHRRSRHRLRLPRLRVPSAGDRTGRPGRPARTPDGGLLMADAGDPGDLADPKALLFDLDGTLVDTVGYRVQAWFETFTAAGIPAVPDRLGVLMGADGRWLARRVAGESGITLDDQTAEDLDRHSGQRFDELNRAPRLHPGVRELLLAVERSAMPWAIATSSLRAQVAASVAALELPSPPRIVDGSHVVHAKPAPDLLLLAAERCATPPQACWYVGDASWDMLAAVAAEMTGIGVASGATEATALRAAGARLTFDAIGELHDLLRQRGLLLD